MNIAELVGKPCDMGDKGVYVIKQIQEPVTVAECSECGERAYDDEAVRLIQAAHNQLAKSA